MYFIIFLISITTSQIASQFTLYTGGNSWALDSNGNNNNLNYTFKALPATFKTYFFTTSASTYVNLFIKMNASVSTNITITLGSLSNTIVIGPNSNFTNVAAGTFLVANGYNQIVTNITGNSSTGAGSVS